MVSSSLSLLPSPPLRTANLVIIGNPLRAGEVLQQFVAMGSMGVLGPAARHAQPPTKNSSRHNAHSMRSITQNDIEDSQMKVSGPGPGSWRL